MTEDIKTVHEGRGGYVEFEGVRYTIDHVAEGCFCIHFPAGKARKDRQRHYDVLTASFRRSRMSDRMRLYRASLS